MWTFDSVATSLVVTFSSKILEPWMITAGCICTTESVPLLHRGIKRKRTRAECRECKRLPGTARVRPSHDCVLGSMLRLTSANTEQGRWAQDTCTRILWDTLLKVWDPQCYPRSNGGKACRIYTVFNKLWCTEFENHWPYCGKHFAVYMCIKSSQCAC